MRINLNQLSILFLLLVWNYSLFPQYFGRNKIQYENFNFQILESDNFDLLYYPSEKSAALDAARMLERWNYRLEKIFRVNLDSNQPIILYADHPDFQQTNVISGFLPQGTGGVTEGLRNRIVLPLTGIYEENDHVLGHELVHAFQYTILKSKSGGLSGTAPIPLWVMEGMAEYLSLGRQSSLTAQWLRDAVLYDDLPSIEEVGVDYRYFPYRYGHAFWSYITAGWGDPMLKRLFDSVAVLGWDDGLQNVLNISSDSLSNLWKEDVKQFYSKQLSGKTHPNEIGRVIISGEDKINLSPAVSPDGKYIAILTQGDIFSIDLYIADAETGELIEELASSNSDRHFDALRFINSAGSWSPDGSRFTFIVQESGDDAISIVEVESGDIGETISLDNVTAISSLAWSPDGRYLAVSGSSGGIGDLFLYDLEAKTTEKLTNDIYTELQPAWSPDGSVLIFATDRGEQTNLKSLKFGNLKLAELNIENDSLRIISISDSAKHLNPHYSPDGNFIYFISNPDGINNIYRIDRTSSQITRITNAATGISGLTENSPALSVAKNTGNLVFTVFNNRSYSVNRLEDGSINETPFSPDSVSYSYNISLPPPSKRLEGIVPEYLNSPGEGLPPADIFTSRDYSPSLGITYIGQTGIGVAVDRFGAGVGGGVSMLFTDMLGNHNLGVVAQVNGGFKDIGGEAMYINQGGRFNYGAVAGHVPYLTGGIISEPAVINLGGTDYRGEKVRFIKQREFHDYINLIGYYPLSQNRRLEAGAGFRRISYDIEADVITAVGNYIVSNTTEDYPAPSGLNIFSANTAYVGDYSFFGFTSPVDGSRFRFEVSQTFGTIDFTSFLADYRRYFFFNPLTFAVRALHYGRYFGSSEDSRITPIFVGNPYWIRGYDLNTFDLSDCAQIGNRITCPEIDRLFGSKVGIFNVELRLPLFGNEQFGLINLGFIPVELSLFFDGGLTWTKEEKPLLKFVKESAARIPIFSTGAALRINLFGYIVGQVYWAFPFQRSDEKGRFGFLLSPGW